MIRSFILSIPLFLAVATSYSQHLLDITPGWPRDSAMAVLAGKYRVADTLTDWNGDAQVIRMAPVVLAGYDGYVILHSDSTGRVTEIVWVRSHENLYEREGGVWSRFTDWQRWNVPTADDFHAMLKSLAPRFDPWPYRIVPQAARVDSTSPAALYTRGWGNNTATVYFWFGRNQFGHDELRYVRKLPPPFLHSPDTR